MIKAAADFSESREIDTDLISAKDDTGRDVIIKLSRKPLNEHSMQSLVSQISEFGSPPPCILEPLFVYHEDDKTGLVNLFMRRGSLYDVISSPAGAFTATERMKAIYGVAASLSWCGKREIQPQNICLKKWMVGEDSEIKLGCFLLDEAMGTDDGTIMWCPEQTEGDCIGEEELLYVFGSVAYAIITWTASPAELARPFAGQFPENATDELRRMITDCWSKTSAGFDQIVKDLGKDVFRLGGADKEMFDAYRAKCGADVQSEIEAEAARRKQEEDEAVAAVDAAVAVEVAAVAKAKRKRKLKMIPVSPDVSMGRLRLQSAHGDVSSMMELARRYEEQNEKQLAMKYYREAAKRDVLDAHFKYGKLLMEEPNKGESCVSHLRKSAHRGHIESMILYGDCLDRGVGGVTSRQGAVKWYKKANKQGNPAARGRLGCAFARGRGVERDIHEAEELLHDASDNGDLRASVEYACMILRKDFRGSKKAAVSYLAAAYQAGTREALNPYGKLFVTGVGVDKDPKAGFRIFEEGNKAGCGDATNNMGMCYEHGIGTKCDIEKAASAYENAISQGSIEAAVNLGKLYFTGRGVLPDRRKAAWLFLAAAERGHPRGMSLYASSLRSGHGVSSDQTLAYDWFRRAAEAGDATGQYQWGKCLYEGEYAKKDLTGAISFLKRASKQGYDKADDLIDKITHKPAK